MPGLESAAKLSVRQPGKLTGRLLAGVIPAAILMAPRICMACAVCFSGRDEATQLAFRVSTGLMTLMPFLLVGGLLLWLRKRFREVAEQERERVLEAEARVRADPAASLPTSR